MTTDPYDLKSPATPAPRTHTLSAPGSHLAWPSLWDLLIQARDTNVYGWVRVQHRVPTEGKLPRWYIAKMIDVMAPTIEVRYEPSNRHSKAWNEDRANETRGDYTQRKIRARKKELAETWGWDTWVRLRAPETLTDEQVALVAKHESLLAKNAESLREQRQAQAEREARVDRINAMDSWMREIHYLEMDAEDLPGDLAGRNMRIAKMKRTERNLVHRKNARHSEEMVRQARIEMLRRKVALNKERYGWRGRK